MKELSIEQKAQAYDEAIKKAESLYKAAEPMSGCNVIIETLFPELKESENERIRKVLIHLVNSNKELSFGIDNYDDIKWSDILAWLKKQGEKKSIDDLTQQEAMDIAVAKCFEQGEQNPNPCDGCINRKGCINCENGELRETEQKPAWSEEDEVKINRIVACLENLNVADNDILLKDVDWLKSLRPQKQ